MPTQLDIIHPQLFQTRLTNSGYHKITDVPSSTTQLKHHHTKSIRSLLFRQVALPLTLQPDYALLAQKSSLMHWRRPRLLPSCMFAG